MFRKQAPGQRLERLKWISAVIGITTITLVEVFHARLGGAFVQHFTDWLIELAAVAVLIVVVFFEASKLRAQLDEKQTESHSENRRRSALVQLSMKIAATLDEEKICEIVVDELQNSMEFQGIELLVVEQGSSRRLIYSSISGRIIIEQEDLYFPKKVIPNYEVPDLIDSSLQPGHERESTRVRVPLKVGNQVFGGLLIKGQTARKLSESDYSVLASAANQTALAIANARLFAEQHRHRLEAEERAAELRDRERYLRIIGEITQAALESKDFLSMLQELTDNLGNLFEADGTFAALWDEANQTSHLVTCYGPLRHHARDTHISGEELMLTQAVLNSGISLVVKDATASPYISSRIAAKLQIRSLLALPLIADNQKLGAAILSFQKEHVFSSQEINFGEQASKQIALAIAKVRALDSANQRTKELTALQRATTALLSTLDLETLLGQILDAAISAIPAAERGSLHLIAQETGQLQIRATHGYTDPRIRTIKLTSQLTYTSQAVRERKPLLVQDTQLQVKDEPIGTNGLPAATSTIIAPLLLGEEVLGAISIDSFHRYAFTQADLDLLVSFAATATMAMQNAQLHAEVQKQAITDALTGLYNRRGFYEFGRREVERSHRFQRPLAAMILDIDLFKDINDEHGHLTGDRVLANMALRCMQELRQIDILGRYGGDEFVALLPETDLESAKNVAERIRKIVSASTFAYEEAPIKITLSIGVTELGDERTDLETLIGEADEALYRAKQSGRDQVVVYKKYAYNDHPPKKEEGDEDVVPVERLLGQDSNLEPSG